MGSVPELLGQAREVVQSGSAEITSSVASSMAEGAAGAGSGGEDVKATVGGF